MKRIFALILVVVSSAGCIASGPNLSFDRPEEAPPGAIPGVPRASQSISFFGSGSLLLQSENFKGYANVSPFSQGLIEGDQFRMLSPSIAIDSSAEKE